MAFGILELARHRKIVVLISVVIALVMIVYFHSVTFRSSTPGDVKVEDPYDRSPFDVNSNGKRTNIKFEPSNEDTQKGEEEMKDVSLNKGNLAQVVIDRAYHQPNEEDGVKGDLNEVMKAVKTEVDLRLAGRFDSKSDKQVPPKDDQKKNSETISGGEHQKETQPHSAVTVASKHVPTGQKENLYVRSSMPLGPALKMPHTERQEAVVDAFRHAWSCYRKYAWGKDDLLPLSKSSSSIDYGMAMTMIDSLDTLWLMGLQEEFNEAREWLAENFNLDNNNRNVVVFEVNIRVVGGLLSAYHLSGDEMFLEKAILVGNHLLPAFDTPSSLPTNRVYLMGGTLDVSHNMPRRYGTINIAEAGSLQLEFRDLSRASGDSRYQRAADRDLDVVFNSTNIGIYPQYYSVSDGHATSSTYTVGSGADSFYEYLLKVWLQSNKDDAKFLAKYLKSAEAIKNNLIGYSKPSSWPFLGTKTGGLGSILHSSMEHLACFYPGLLALGLLNNLHPQQRALAEGLTKTCYMTYNSTPTGLAADSFSFNTSPFAKTDYYGSMESKNIQRPETVESIFIMYRLTKDPKYREWGWKIFQAFETNMRVEGGYASVSNVNRKPPPHVDKMESFFLAETLKYLFLLFGDNDSVISFDEWVFNTEAHPLPIWNKSSGPVEQSV